MGGVRDIVKPGYCGELEYSNNVDKFSDRIVKLAKNKVLLQKMGKNAIQNYKDNYDARKILKVYEELYTYT